MGVVVERADSQFGRYVSAKWRDPSDPVLGLAHIWYFAGTLAHALERHYPDGTGGIVVQLDTPHAPEGAGPGERFPPLCTNGLATRHFAVVAPAGGCRVLGIMLDPATLCAVLRTPLRELTDVTVDLHAVVGAAAAELGDRCARAGDPAAVVLAALAWVRARIAAARPIDGDVRYTLGRLLVSRGALPIGAIAAEFGFGGPRLARRFAALIGTTPKRFGRILRFNHALELIRGGGDLTTAAHTAGYYDQAHMYGDFAEFCDRTPAGFARALHYPNAVSVAEHTRSSERSRSA